MDLRAFLYKFILVLVISMSNQSGFASFNPHNIPYEIKFADVNFQLNEVTRYLVQNELKAILANKEVYQNQMDRFYTFLPVVEPMLQSENVPQDFKFLVIYDKYQSSIEQTTKIENGVFWCLNKSMAEDVDLVMNQQIDERKHLIAATKGASICLKRNQVLYKNWGTTLFSHLADKKVLNLLEVVRKWSSNEYILLESPAYSAILQFLAYKLAIENGFQSYHPSTQKILYEYPYSKGKTINKISSELKVEPNTLSEYNSWLQAKTVPDTECKILVVVPAERYNEIRNLAELTQRIGLPAKDLGFPILKKNPEFAKKLKDGIFYEANGIKAVQAEMCDNFVTLAYKANLPLKRFLEYNNLTEKDLIHVGQVYYLDKKEDKATVPFHVVREGESLWDVSQTYGIDLKNLLDFNRMESAQRMQRGRILWMQKTRPKKSPIEYVELPNEFKEIEEVFENESELIPIESIEKDTVKQEKTKEIDLNSLPLTQEIRKDTIKNVNLRNIVDTKEVTQKNDVKKVDNTTEKRSTDSSKPKSQTRFLYHSVKKEETLFRISNNYKVSLDDLRKLNNLRSDIIEIGTVLKIKKL